MPETRRTQRNQHICNGCLFTFARKCARNTSPATAASTQRTRNEHQKRHQHNARQEHSRKDGSNQGNGNAAKLQRSGKTPPPEKCPAQKAPA